jgi:hypothetical protein
MEMGNNVKDGGGKFKTDVNSTNQLVGTRLQTSRQSNYAKQYSSYYTQVDGTYGTNKYDMKSHYSTQCYTPNNPPALQSDEDCRFTFRHHLISRSSFRTYKQNPFRSDFVNSIQLGCDVV